MKEAAAKKDATGKAAAAKADQENAVFVKTEQEVAAAVSEAKVEKEVNAEKRSKGSENFEIEVNKDFEDLQFHAGEVSRSNQTLAKKVSSIDELEFKLQSLREDLVSKELGSNETVTEMKIEKISLVFKEKTLLQRMLQEEKQPLPKF